MAYGRSVIKHLLNCGPVTASTGYCEVEEFLLAKEPPTAPTWNLHLPRAKFVAPPERGRSEWPLPPRVAWGPPGPDPFAHVPATPLLMSGRFPPPVRPRAVVNACRGAMPAIRALSAIATEGHGTV